LAGAWPAELSAWWYAWLAGARPAELSAWWYAWLAGARGAGRIGALAVSVPGAIGALAVSVPGASGALAVSVLGASGALAALVPGGREPDELGPGPLGGRLLGLPNCAVARTVAGQSAAQKEW
jgi:hypothetical protein